MGQSYPLGKAEWWVRRWRERGSWKAGVEAGDKQRSSGLNFNPISLPGHKWAGGWQGEGKTGALLRWGGPKKERKLRSPGLVPGAEQEGFPSWMCMCHPPTGSSQEVQMVPSSPVCESQHTVTRADTFIHADTSLCTHLLTCAHSLKAEVQEATWAPQGTRRDESPSVPALLAAWWKPLGVCRGHKLSWKEKSGLHSGQQLPCIGTARWDSCTQGGVSSNPSPGSRHRQARAHEALVGLPSIFGQYLSGAQGLPTSASLLIPATA
jgi:hypothetical protein